MQPVQNIAPMQHFQVKNRLLFHTIYYHSANKQRFWASVVVPDFVYSFDNF